MNFKRQINAKRTKVNIFIFKKNAYQVAAGCHEGTWGTKMVIYRNEKFLQLSCLYSKDVTRC